MYPFLTYCSIFSPLLPLAIGRKGLEKCDSLKIIYGFVIISFISDLASMANYYIIGGSNYWIINIYQYSEVILVYFFLYKALMRKFVVLILMVIMLILTIWNHILSGNTALVAESASINSIVILILCLSYFLIVFLEEKTFFIENDPEFWIVVSLLVYFSGGLFSWLFKSFASQELNYNWAFHNLSNILKNFLFAVGFWKVRHLDSKSRVLL